MGISKCYFYDIKSMPPPKSDWPGQELAAPLLPFAAPALVVAKCHGKTTAIPQLQQLEFRPGPRQGDAAELPGAWLLLDVGDPSSPSVDVPPFPLHVHPKRAAD